MAKGVEKVRTKGTDLAGSFGPLGPLGEKIDPLSIGIKRTAQGIDKKLADKGAFLESTLAGQQRKASKVKKRQEAEIGKQRQAEELRLSEAESEVQRRRFLKKAGGRRSLIASR